MLEFVNCKINIGLSVVRKREDGYHDLESVFYPVGKGGPLPEQPDPFADILEICSSSRAADEVICSGNVPDCRVDDNLVSKALRLYSDAFRSKTGCEAKRVDVRLEKYLPFGAGLGGGSADASFTLKMLDRLNDNRLGEEELLILSKRLGADCPFFIKNVPAFVSGIGDELHPIELDLKGKYIVIVKPPFTSSTKEAFAGITPARPEFDLRKLPELPLNEWRDKIFNDFEKSLFPTNPQYGEIKERLYASGAFYASLSGSGSAMYGLFYDFKEARNCKSAFESTINGVWLLRL